MSRRQEQEIREYMRLHGVKYNVAKRALSAAPRHPEPADARLPTPSGVPYQVLVGNGTAQPDLTTPAVAAAMRLQLELLGGDGDLDAVDTNNAFLPRFMHVGLCRTCGRKGELSFEHLPPAAAGNSSRARGVSALRILTSDDPTEIPRSGWFPAQRGVGAHVLCKPCNELFGDRYVRSYIDFIDKVGLAAIAAIRERGNGVIPGFVTVDLSGWPLGDVAREGLVQLLDLGVHDRLIRRFPVLSDIVLSGSTGMPPDVRLGLTLILNTAQSRVSSPMIEVRENGEPFGPAESVILFSEVAMAPFSWTLSFTGDGRRMLGRTADVSSWLDLRPGELAAPTPLELPVGTLGSATPGDFSVDSLLSK
jgi:hypothetical protein